MKTTFNFSMNGFKTQPSIIIRRRQNMIIKKY
jgi:hypothetical protein